MTVAQMQQTFPYIQWMDYINKMLDGAEKVGQNDVILVGVPKYITGLQGLLRTTPKRYAYALRWKSATGFVVFVLQGAGKLPFLASDFKLGTLLD